MNLGSLSSWFGAAQLRRYIEAVPDHVGWSDQVQKWCMGGNDEPNTGDCTLAAYANLNLLVTTVAGKPLIMPDVEVKSAYRQIAGWLPNRPDTDHGVAIATMLDYLDRNGWPGDPTIRPTGWCPIVPEEIPLGIVMFGACLAWCMLPQLDNTWDLTDAACDQGVEGTGPHAVLITDAEPGQFRIITWARSPLISRRWWEMYGRGQFGVQLPMWHRPADLLT